jgi:hypothetical protein
MQKNVGERWFVCKLGTSPPTVATIAHLKSLVHIMIMPRRVVAIRRFVVHIDDLLS